MHEIYERSKRLYNRLKQTQHNLLAIIQSIRRWSRDPLYQRCAYGRNLLDAQQQQERLRQRRVQCDETRRLLNRLLIANFCLFFDYDQQRGEFEGHDDQCIQEVGLLWLSECKSFVFTLKSCFCSSYANFPLLNDAATTSI